jgi:hypothetical protein
VINKTVRQYLRADWLCLFVLMLFASSAQAQFSSGLEGTVTDSTGAAIPDATLELFNLEQGTTQKQVSSASGYYHFNSLPASAFKLTVSAKGFSTRVQQGIKLEVSKITTVNAALTIGSISEEVTVSEAPPSIQTADPGVGGFVSSTQVHELPLVGRNFIGLVALTPGITGLPSGGGQISAQAGGDVFTGDLTVSMNANGLRSEQNGFTVDGGDVTSMTRGGITNFNPSADSVQEFRVTVNAFTAEYAGAGAHVDVVTKSGSNHVHGNADWFTTNQVFQARNEFQTAPVPDFSRNEYAGAIGGPIRKDHTFFFASIDKLLSTVPYAAPVTIETPQFIDWMKQNVPNHLSTYILSTFPNLITNFSSTQNAGQVLNGATFNCGTMATVTTVAGVLPCTLPVTGTGLLSTKTPRNGLQWGFRLDQIFNNSKDRFDISLYRTFVDQVSGSPSSFYPAFTSKQPEATYNAHVSETHTFKSSLLNDFTYSFVRLDGYITCPNCSLPQITQIVGASAIGNSGPIGFIQNNFQTQDHVSWDHGSHSVRFGVSWLRNESNYHPNDSYTRPIFSFASPFAFAADQPFQESNFFFNPLTGAKTFLASSVRQPIYALFVGDTWKIKSNLTLTAGLRWETFGKVTDNKGTTNYIFQGGTDLFSKITNARVSVVPSDLAQLRYGDLGPRLGLTWDPTKTGKLSIRLGFGRYYDAYTSQVYGGAAPAFGPHFNPPFAAAGTASIFQSGPQPLFAKGTSDTAPFNIPYPTGILLGLNQNGGPINSLASVSGTDRDLPTAYSQNWFLGIQYAFAHNWVAEGDYVGSQGHHLYNVYNVNRFAGDLIQNKNVLKRYNPYFGSMGYAQGNLNSNYSGAVFSIKAPSFHGANISGAYTFGKALDQQSSFSENMIEDAAHLENERGRADFDVRHKVSLSVVWQLPGEHLSSHVLRSVVGNWQLSDVTIFQSGQPFTVYTTAPFGAVLDANKNVIGNTGGDYNADGNNYDRPGTPSFGNVNRGSQRSDYIKGLFAKSAFPTPAFGQEGNLGRNTFHGPGYANSNTTLTKHFPLPWFRGDKADGEFKAEAFNIFNRVNPSTLISDTSNSLFGKATSTFPARQFQFGVRLSF